MHRHDVEVIAALVIGKRDVERAIGFNHVHHQALGIGSRSGVLFEHRSFLDHTQRLLSGNPPFSSAQQGMVAPDDARGVRDSADCEKVKGHRGKDIRVA